MLHNLYEVRDWQQEPDRLDCTVRYNAAHPLFGGHFPGQPVVPGVCTMDMVKELLERALSQKLLLRSTGQVKFLQLILPEVQPAVTVSWQPAEGGYQTSAVLRGNGTDLFKMNALFERL